MLGRLKMAPETRNSKMTVITGRTRYRMEKILGQARGVGGTTNSGLGLKEQFEKFFLPGFGDSQQRFGGENRRGGRGGGRGGFGERRGDRVERRPEGVRGPPRGKRDFDRKSGDDRT